MSHRWRSGAPKTEGSSSGSARPHWFSILKPARHRDRAVQPCPLGAGTTWEASVAPPSQFRPYFEGLLLLLLAAGFFTLAGTGRLGSGVVLLGGAALVARGILWALGIRPRMSNGFTNLVSALYLIFYPLDYFFLSHGFLTATVHLVLLVAVLKLFSAVRPRDFAYLCVLAFLEVLAAATLTVGSGFLGYFAIFLVLTVATVICYELFRAEVSAPVRGVLAAPAGGHAPRLRRPLATVSLAAAVSVAACGGALFFLLPRFSIGYWQPNAGVSRLSGFSDDVHLGEIGRLELSSRPVLHVRLQSSTPPVAPGSLELYWTGRVLTQFDGRDWFDPHHPLPTSTIFGQLQFPAPPERFAALRRVIRYQVILEPVGSDVLFFAPQLRLISTHFSRLGVEATGTLSSGNGAFGETAYSAVSALVAPPAAELRHLGRNYPPLIRAEDLQLPPGLDPRIARLAHRVAGSRRDPYSQMAALTRYLRGHYRYTLNLREPGQHPLAAFLFRYHAGHCEYFASALAVMGRMLGIPTRVVNGFAGGEYNPISREYVLRGRDAHSWVEAYFPAPEAASIGSTPSSGPLAGSPPGVWVRFDATPSTTVAGGWSRLSQYADALSSFWQEWVINYDIFHQLSLARGVGQQVHAAAGSWRRDWRGWFAWGGAHGWRHRTAILWRWLARPEARQAGGVGLAILAMLAGLAAAVRMGPWARHGLRRWPAGQVASDATWYYRRLRRLLEHAGFSPPPRCTPEELAWALPASGVRPAIRPAVSRFVTHYQQVRFGGEAAVLPQLEDDLRAVETALR